MSKRRLYGYIEQGLENEVKAGRVMRYCYECGLRPAYPNYLSVYRCDSGEIYSRCILCEDWERDYQEATAEERAKMNADPGYGEWLDKWHAEMEGEA